eukprot:UN00915
MVQYRGQCMDQCIKHTESILVSVYGLTLEELKTLLSKYDGMHISAMLGDNSVHSCRF